MRRAVAFVSASPWRLLAVVAVGLYFIAVAEIVRGL